MKSTRFWPQIDSQFRPRSPRLSPLQRLPRLAGASWRAALAACCCMLVLLAAPQAQARGSLAGGVSLNELPREARSTYELIHAGGPFPYPKDGVTFGNYEGVLPKQRRGYYHEYTVPTPGARNRGARRIVCGGTPEQWSGKRPAACYYTDDHYASFRQIRE